jgi:hypothetical protein
MTMTAGKIASFVFALKNQAEENRVEKGASLGIKRQNACTKLHPGQVYLSFASMFSTLKSENETRSNAVPHSFDKF